MDFGALMSIPGVAMLLLAGAVPAAAVQRPAAAPSLVFEGVTVVDVEQGKLVRAQRVVITGNRIQAVGDGRTVQVPQGAQVVEAGGKYLIPGLWDMHVHTMHAAATFYPLFLANGVTGIRDAGSPVSLDSLLLWRREILAGARIGPPRQILSGPALRETTSFDSNGQCDRHRLQKLNDPQACVTDSADAMHIVDSLKAAGADMIKPRSVKPGIFFAIAAEARRRGILFGGHAGPDFGLTPRNVASDSGASILDHGSVDFDECQKPGRIEECRRLAELFKRNRTWVEWDEGYLHLNSGLTGQMNERMNEFWDGKLRAGKWLSPADTAESDGWMRVAQAADLPIVAGTDVGAPGNGHWYPSLADAPPGFYLHEILAAFVLEGLTPLTALQAATLNPAKALRGTDSLGTVAAGKLADLVLLDGDPLVDITNTTAIRAVVANGRYFDRPALDRVLAEARATILSLAEQAAKKPEP